MAPPPQRMVLARSLCFLLILLVVTPPYWVAVLACGVLPRRLRWHVIAGWARFATRLARAVLGIRYRVEGIENIPAEPCVILSKHSSAWETIGYSCIFPPHVYVIKRELLWIPFLGWGLALFSPIAINRSNRKQAMRRITELGAQRFAQGFSVLIFPEGTRVPTGKRVKYRAGGATLAVNLQAKVLPVAHNAGLLWPRNSLRKFPGCITVRIGAPIDCAGRTAEAVLKEVEHWIETEAEALNAGGTGAAPLPPPCEPSPLP
jgi:1-acyl-sn-glycerol-3-phosphate acyltransferase